MPPRHRSATTRPSSVTESIAATVVHECSRPPSRDSRSRHHSVPLSLAIRSSPPQPHLLAICKSLPQPSSPRNCIVIDHYRILKGAGVASAALAFILRKVLKVMDVTELETDETEHSHTVELDLVYHSLNSSMLGVVAIRYRYNWW
ncbi:hypothetical protein S83_026611 [Arachis hypogaea]